MKAEEITKLVNAVTWDSCNDSGGMEASTVEGFYCRLGHTHQSIGEAKSCNLYAFLAAQAETIERLDARQDEYVMLIKQLSSWLPESLHRITALEFNLAESNKRLDARVKAVEERPVRAIEYDSPEP